MTESVPLVRADLSGNGVGSTLLGLVVQALSWLAFGFCLCGGWHAMEWLLRKV